VEAISRATVPVVLAESTRVAIEKMATELAHDLLSDPVFREELRNTVRRIFAESVRPYTPGDPAD
jgi:hypothetical protein